MARIIFIEGLPGSGKTTFAKRLSEDLKGDVRLFIEGDLHPIDLAWCSYTDDTTYHRLLERFPEQAAQIQSHSRFEDGHWITAYTQVRPAPKRFYDAFEMHEVYRYQDLEPFHKIHVARYQTFAETADAATYIFECVLLQNHINELILKHDLSQSAMIAYFQALLEPLRQHDIQLIHLVQSDVETTLRRVVEERRSDNPEWPDWIDLVVAYIERLPHAKPKGYLGTDGALRYFKDRQATEQALLPKLDIPYKTIVVNDDYDPAYERLLDHLR